jgi:hypothetical protein
MLEMLLRCRNVSYNPKNSASKVLFGFMESKETQKQNLSTTEPAPGYPANLSHCPATFGSILTIRTDFNFVNVLRFLASE